MENKQGELAVVNQEVALQSESGMLLKMAIDKDLDVDKLKALMDLKNQEEERQCKKDFDFHFNEMQKDYIPATKGNNVLNKAGDKILYKFCSLEDILKVYSPIISNHGFSFKWREEMTGDNNKKISCIISGYGHDEIGSVEIPINEGNSFTNSIQQRGVSTSYGKRYSFINSFGVIIEDEDNDANLTFDSAVQYSEEITWLKSCESKEDLIKAWKQIYEQLKQKDDLIGKQVLTTVYNEQKEVIK